MRKLAGILIFALLFNVLIGCGIVGSDEPVDVPQVHKFRIKLGEPMVLDQAEPGNQAWGNYQFPEIVYTVDGNIYAYWCYESVDDIKYQATYHGAISTDRGKTWTSSVGHNTVSGKNLMSNGCYFTGFTKKGAHKAEWINDYQPAYEIDGNAYYFLSDMPENADTLVSATEYDPVTGEVNTFNCKVNWPNAPLVKMGEMVYPATMMFALSNRSVMTVDGVLYYPMYFYGFDSVAESRDKAVDDYVNYQHIYFFKSEDNGRTWDFVSQVRTGSNLNKPGEGFCEPEMTVTPDGSWVMLMRTGSANPSYITRSTDKGMTWSAPELFDGLGVMPQLCTLACGVTIASYGRPSMRLRATSDPAGQEWGKTTPIEIQGSSCYYTDLIPIDAYTALFIYSDFGYPNQNGEPVKTILVRTITIVPED